MFLALKDLAGLFQNKHGVQDDILFYTVTDQASAVQPKGLFVPINKESGELLEAITNGAIAAIWDHERKLPRYTPSQFPIFFTDDLAEATKDIITLYRENLDGETDRHMEITNFKLSNKQLLNKNKQTYDIAGILAMLNDEGRRG